MNTNLYLNTISIWHFCPFQTWNIGSVTYYGEQIAQGRQLPKAYSDIEDDPHQMGGDFIISKSGHFLLVHCSTVPTDRPSVDTLLTVFKN
mgnify:FL=1